MTVLDGARRETETALRLVGWPWAPLVSCASDARLTLEQGELRLNA
jgi:hypothetical protein